MAKKQPTITASEIEEFCDKQETRYKPLFDRMEDHSAFLRNDWFKMPGPHAENYQTMPTAKPLAFKNKISSELSAGTIIRSIPIDGKESEKDKENFAITEQTSYGLTVLGNDRLRSLQLPSIQAQVADDIAERGWVGERVWLYEETEHGAPKLIVDVSVWDILNVRWAIGKNGLSRVVNIRYATEEEVKDEYPKAEGYPVDSNGLVMIRDYWDKEWELVEVGGEIVDSQFHNRGYVPVYIMPVGPSRLRQSSRYTDGIRYVGESFASNGGEIVWPYLSQIQSYYLTTVALGTHPPQKWFYKGAGNLPVFDDPKSIWESGAGIPLDTEKGQDVAEMFKPTMPQDAAALFNIAANEEEIISAAKILSGNVPANSTAQGIAMLIHAAMGILKNGKTAREGQDEWEANELVRQYKDGPSGGGKKFSEIPLQGVDGKQKQFDITASPDKLATDRRIRSTLMLDVLQDQMAKVDLGGKLKQLGWISNQTGMDKFAGVADPESESQRIAYERAVELTGADDWKVIEQAILEGDKITAWRVMLKIQQEVAAGQQMMQQNQGNVSALGQMNPMPGKVKMPPQGMTPTGSVPSRLKALGMVEGR